MIVHRAADSEIDKGDEWRMSEVGGELPVGMRGNGGGLTRSEVPPSSMVRGRSVQRRRSMRPLFSEPFLAFLEVFIEKHGQVPDHER